MQAVINMSFSFRGSSGIITALTLWWEFGTGICVAISFLWYIWGYFVVVWRLFFLVIFFVLFGWLGWVFLRLFVRRFCLFGLGFFGEGVG